MIPNDNQRNLDILLIFVTSADFMHMYLFFPEVGPPLHQKCNWTGTGTRAAGVPILPRFKSNLYTTFIWVGNKSFEKSGRYGSIIGEGQ